MKTGNDEVRMQVSGLYAALSLTRMDSAAVLSPAFPALLLMSEDKLPEVRLNSAMTIANLKPKIPAELMPLPQKLAQDKDQRVTKTARAGMAMLSPATRPATERVMKDMLWIDPPTPRPGLPVPHEPNTIDFAFAESPSNHVLLQSAVLLAKLRAKGKKRMGVTFEVTWSPGGELRGYYVTGVEDHVFDPATDQGLGSFQIGGTGAPLPFAK